MSCTKYGLNYCLLGAGFVGASVLTMMSSSRGKKYTQFKSKAKHLLETDDAAKLFAENVKNLIDEIEQVKADLVKTKGDIEQQAKERQLRGPIDVKDAASMKLSVSENMKKIRIANFSRRIYVILERFIYKFQKRKNNLKYKIKYFINEQIVSDLDKKNIYESFNNKVLEIKNNLREDQLLILSTTLTNDLYLPIHDFQNLNNNSIKSLNNKISNFLIKYDFINSNAFDVNNTEDFPDGATLEYLKGVNCLNKNFLKVYPNDFNNCKEFYHAAREADGLPLRTLPSLNSKIRLLKNKYKNIKVIDPDIRLLNEKNNYLFLEYFVDFQHPSALGHSIIAEEILKILSPTKKIKFNKIDKCDNFKIESVEVDEKIKPDVESFKYIIEANIRWLKNFNLKTFKPNLHQFYIKEASIKQKNCYK